MDAPFARIAGAGADAPGSLDGVPAEAAARAIAAAGDVVLLVDGGGIIIDVRVGGTELAGEGLSGWRGRPWAATVCDDSAPKVAEILADTASGAVPRWRLINHRIDGGELPVRYIAVPGGGGDLIAIGRDMRAVAAMQQRLIRAQQAMERDTMSLRQIEARYRLLFETAGDAVIVVDTATQRIVEANPAARRLAGAGARLDGEAFSSIVDPGDRDSALSILGAVAAAEQARPARIRLVGGGSCQLAATLFRQDRATFLLLRLTAAEGQAPAAARSLAEVLDGIPDPFVLTDAELNILTKNAAFLELVHQPRGDDVRGLPLGRFVGRPGIDLGLLAGQLRDHGQVRNFATIVRDARGREEEVEVSAVGAPDADGLRYGFTVRPAARRVDPGGGATLPRSVEQLTELVGRVSLKEIVRESTDLIERLCIEAALVYTADNRASAAEILGLSRQSLYSKLHRHGLGNLVADKE